LLVETTSVAKLKTHLSSYLAKVRAGGTIEITAHRKAVARITGVPDEAPDRLSRLVAEGRVRVGQTGPMVFGPPIDLDDEGMSVSEMVLEDRGPR